MVSPEMSMSTDGGMSAGLALMCSVNSCWSTMPSPCWTSMASPTRLMGISAEMTSSRRTIWKSTWVTTFRNGWCWMSRASVRKLSLPTSQGEQGVEAGLTGHGDLELAGPDRHRDGLGAVAVDHPGDLPLGPQTAGRTRSGLAAGFGGERDFGHAGTPREMRTRGQRRSGTGVPGPVPITEGRC